MMSRRLELSLLVLAVGLPLVSCGGSEPAPDGGSSGTGAAGGSSGTGGAGATGGVMQSGGTGGGGPGTGGIAGNAGVNGIGATGGGAGRGADGGRVGTGGSPAGTGGTGEESGASGEPATGGLGATGGGGSAGTGATSGAGGAGATGGSSSGGSGGSSPGCGSTNTTSACGMKGTTCSMEIAGKSRTYYVQLPKDYDPATPHRLIFQFHPWGGSADQALTMYGLNSSIADAIFVTPQGLDAGGQGPGWANSDGEDIEFTKGMLAEVQGKYCVDNARIFSVGFSYGGMMSFAVACEMSNVFRAIAPMSGALYSDPQCKGSGPPIAMWGSHGLNDTVVPIENGRAARDKVLAESHCGTTTTPVDPSPCVKYEGCDAGYDVTWCEWDGPHGIPSFGSSAIAAFFKQF